jgi:hypothetical protein
MPVEDSLTHLTVQGNVAASGENQAPKASKERAGAVFEGLVRLAARWRNCMNQHRHLMD